MTEKQSVPPRRVLCVGAVVLQDDAILFVRQTYGGLQGKWTIPWGFVDPTDTPDAAAIREAKEEAGVEVAIQGLMGIQNHTVQNDELRLYLIFLCKHLSGTPAPDDYETDRAEYFSWADVIQHQPDMDAFCFQLARQVFENRYHCIPVNPDMPYADAAFL